MSHEEWIEVVLKFWGELDPVVQPKVGTTLHQAT